MNPFDSGSSHAPLLRETDNEPSLSSQTSPTNHVQLESSSSAYVSLNGNADSATTPVGDSLIVKQSRWERVKHHAKNIFGAYLVCDVADDTTCCTHNPRCVVTDEVRMSAWILLLILALIVLILAIIDISSGKVTVSGIADHKHYAAVAVAACFAFAATIITGHQVAAHRRHWTYPRAQIKILRIIMMVPIYAWSAWFGLIFVELAVYIDFIRVCYEAFVIFNFLLLLTRYLGGQEGAIAILQREKNREMHWPTPCCCLPKFRFSSRFLYHIKRGTLQYVLISPLASFAAVLLGALGHYEDGVLDWTNGYVYIAIIQNCTQMVALYCLVWFYLVAKDDLAPFNPLAKFIVVKSVVFFTFWQGVGINVLTKIGVIHDTGDFTAAQVQVGLQDFIICIEMFFAAAVHRWTFGHEPFADGSFQQTLDTIQASRKTEFAAEVLSAEVETPVVISDYRPPQATAYDPTASVMRRISPEEETDNENALI